MLSQAHNLQKSADRRSDKSSDPTDHSIRKQQLSHIKSLKKQKLKTTSGRTKYKEPAGTALSKSVSGPENPSPNLVAKQSRKDWNNTGKNAGDSKLEEFSAHSNEDLSNKNHGSNFERDLKVLFFSSTTMCTFMVLASLIGLVEFTNLYISFTFFSVGVFISRMSFMKDSGYAISFLGQLHALSQTELFLQSSIPHQSFVLGGIVFLSHICTPRAVGLATLTVLFSVLFFQSVLPNLFLPIL